MLLIVLGVMALVFYVTSQQKFSNVKDYYKLIEYANYR